MIQDANFRTFSLKHLRHLTGVRYHSETNYVIYYQVIKPKNTKIEKKYSKEQKLAKSQKNSNCIKRPEKDEARPKTRKNQI